MDAITLKQLRALSEVMRCGGVSAAASALGLTPPAVSTQLKALEGNVGSAVLTRGSDGRPAPTIAGAEILETARRVEVCLESCRQRLDSIAAGQRGFVSLGVVSTGKYFAPKVVALARKSLPGVEIALRIGNREETIAALLDGAVDLAIMGRPPRATLAAAERLALNPHVLIARPDHPLVGNTLASSQAIAEEVFLLREPGSGTRMLTERLLDDLRIASAVQTLEFGSNETIKQGVIAGLGVAVISQHTVVAELASGRLATIAAPGLPIVRHWFVVRAAERALDKTAEAVVRFLFEERAAYLGMI